MKLTKHILAEKYRIHNAWELAIKAQTYIYIEYKGGD